MSLNICIPNIPLSTGMNKESLKGSVGLKPAYRCSICGKETDSLDYDGVIQCTFDILSKRGKCKRCAKKQ